MFQGNQYYWVAAGECSAPAKQSIWTLEESRVFEEAILLIPEGSSHRWEKIASLLPGKSPVEVKELYDAVLRNWREMDAAERVESSSYMNQPAPVLGQVPVLHNWREMDSAERVESSSYMNQPPPVLGQVPVLHNLREMDAAERVESSSYMNQPPPVLGQVPEPTQISVEARRVHGEDQCKKRTPQTIEEHRLFFEEALMQFVAGTPLRWDTIGCYLPWMSSMEEAMFHCRSETEPGQVDLPSQVNEPSLVLDSRPPPPPPPPTHIPLGARFPVLESGLTVPPPSQILLGARREHDDNQPKKRIFWTEEEHRLFLYGLEKYGKGKWKKIANEVVLTKTPAQVASHAQKFFLRHSPANQLKRTKRSSIHDITNAFPSNDP